MTFNSNSPAVVSSIAAVYVALSTRTSTDRAYKAEVLRAFTVPEFRAAMIDADRLAVTL